MSNYQVRAIFQDSSPKLYDLEIIRENASTLHMIAGNPKRELDILLKLEQLEGNFGIILLGSGVGYTLESLIEKYPNNRILVVDKELDILAVTMLQARFAKISWIIEADYHSALQKIQIWQEQQECEKFVVLAHPVYLRLEKNDEYYKNLRNDILLIKRIDIWDKLKKAPFSNNSCKILLITSKYFLMGEIIDACKRLNIEYHLIALDKDEINAQLFVYDFLQAVLAFRPDFVLTLNHLGVDREGLLIDMLSKLELPLASWFLDNPNLILNHYENLYTPFTTIFTWDYDNIQELKAQGFPKVHYLPLATDHLRFNPKNYEKKTPLMWKSKVSFVGNSMLYKIASKLKQSNFSAELLKNYKQIALDFILNSEHSISTFIQKNYPNQYSAYTKLPNVQEKLNYETLIIWEATKQYRSTCVKQILDFTPLFVGDPGWYHILKDQKKAWRWLENITYYTDLPYFYPKSCINFNCTSIQMKGAPNQRIFDVPASGAFVLSDYREQMEELFEIGSEIICFKEAQEIPSLIKFYLENPRSREKITAKAHARILAEHTWDHRLQKIIDIMKCDG